MWLYKRSLQTGACHVRLALGSGSSTLRGCGSAEPTGREPACGLSIPGQLPTIAPLAPVVTPAPPTTLVRCAQVCACRRQRAACAGTSPRRGPARGSPHAWRWGDPKSGGHGWGRRRPGRAVRSGAWLRWAAASPAPGAGGARGAASPGRGGVAAAGKVTWPPGELLSHAPRAPPSGPAFCGLSRSPPQRAAGIGALEPRARSQRP